MILSDRSERRRRLRRSHLGQTALTAYSNHVIRFFWRDKHPVFLQQGSVLKKSGQPESQVYGKTPGDKSLPPSFLACLFPCCTTIRERGKGREGEEGSLGNRGCSFFIPAPSCRQQSQKEISPRQRGESPRGKETSGLFSPRNRAPHLIIRGESER